MTLVLSALTSRHVYQVSDKRITSLHNGSVLDDDRVKAVQYCNQMVFAYTGLAELDGRPFHEWLVDVLGEHWSSLEEAVKYVADALTQRFSLISLSPAQKRHAVVGVGWAQLDNEEHLSPFQIVISNAMARAGQWEPTAASEFHVRGVELNNQSVYVSAAGAAMPPEVLVRLKRDLTNAVERGATPAAIIHLLAVQVRRAAQQNSTVGSQLIAMVLPRDAVASNSSGLWGPPSLKSERSWSTPAFFHLSANSDQLVYTTPAFTCYGFTVYGGQIGAGP